MQRNFQTVNMRLSSFCPRTSFTIKKHQIWVVCSHRREFNTWQAFLSPCCTSCLRIALKMTSITIQIAPNLKNAENFSNSSILSDLNVIMKNKGFNDILDHGRFIFNDVIKPLEEDCKKRNIPPLVFTVTVSDALALAIESISQYSQLSCSTVAKIIVYRSNELRQMKGY